MAGGRFDKSGGNELVENSEINVTPFIDVMLVLLIIFMVAAPLATVDVSVDLPIATAPPQKPPEEQIYLTLKADLSLHLGETPVTRDGLAAALDGMTAGDRDRRIFVRADKGVDYGAMMAVLNLLREAGRLKIALVGLETVPGAAP
jgi:biopolymer transport protein ExbD